MFLVRALPGGAFAQPGEANYPTQDTFYKRRRRLTARMPLADKLRSVTDDAGTVLGSATMLDTKELRWWRLVFSDHVTVLG